MFKDKVGVRGRVSYTLYDEDGNIKKQSDSYNTATELQDAVLATMMHMGESSTTGVGFIDCGTGTGGGASSTSLVTPITDSRIGISKATTAGGDDNDLVVTTTIPAGKFTATIEEFGLFRDFETATMMYYDDNSASGHAIPKGASDTLAITWTITYGAS